MHHREPRFPIRVVFSTVMLICVLLVSCGKDTSTTQVTTGSSASLLSTTTTSPIDELDLPDESDTEPNDEGMIPATTSIATLPSVPDISVFRTNMNDPSTPMGVLCWIVWEILRQQVLLWEDPTEVSKTMILTPAEDMYKEFNKHIQRDDFDIAKLPYDIQLFGTALFAIIDKRLEGESIDKWISFDDLEGSDQFVDAIPNSPECVMPGLE